MIVVILENTMAQSITIIYVYTSILIEQKNQNKSWIIYTEREAGRQGLRIENNIYKLHNIKNIQIPITI